MTIIPLPGAASPAPLPRAPLPFVAWRRFGFAVTFLLVVATMGALATRGLSLGLDFTGGVVVHASRSTPFEVGAVRTALAGHGLDEAVIQLMNDGTVIVVRGQILADSATLGASPRTSLGASPAIATVDAIRSALGPDARIMKSETVGPKVSEELLRKGVLASLLAVSAIAVYVWTRFTAKFGWAALATTAHDVIVMVGFYAVTGLTFDLTAIAALLAIAGYSINDTVIVFDRIRETLGRQPGTPLAEAIDRSVTDTLRRTLATSGTTLMTSLSIMLLGGPMLFAFGAAISFGILVGTFSSIFVAASLLLYLPGTLPGMREPDPASTDVDRDAA